MVYTMENLNIILPSSYLYKRQSTMLSKCQISLTFLEEKLQCYKILWNSSRFLSWSPRSNVCVWPYNFYVATMTWLTATGYLCHKLPRICSVCRNYNLVLSSFMTYHRLCNKSHTTDAACGIGIVYLSVRNTCVHPRCLVRFVLLNL